MQMLLLQKPSKRSKAKDHISHLKRRLELWKQGNIEALVQEGECIQKPLVNKPRPSDNDAIARNFGRMMEQGKVKAALRYLSQNTSGGVLKLEDVVPANGSSEMHTTHDILIDKNPVGQPPVPQSLISITPDLTDPIIFDSLNANTIQHAALRMQGSGGPSGLDAFAWRRFCTSFGQASHDLCSALAAVGRRICSSLVSTESIGAFVACRLIPLNKCPGVRPIGVGEVPRRIIAKAVLGIISHDIENAAGSLQVCAGQAGGCEAAVHAMRKISQYPETEGTLLVDGENAFNSLNRRAALHNVSVLCPPLKQILVNTYRAPVRMIIAGSREI